MGLAIRVKPHKRVLELGCSSGYLSKYLTEELACHVVGVDLNSEALQQAAPFCQQTIVADLDNDAWLKEIEGQKFDVVLCADVLEHLKNPAAMLTSLKPFLHQESILLASVPNVAHVSVRLELLQGHFDYESLGLLDDTHLHFYTRDGLLTMLMQAGYECCDISYSINDMADQAIDQHLASAGLVASDAARKFLHAPDAVAFQYIIEARPVDSELQQPLPLSPKPLVSSGVAHHEQQEKIDHLEHQLIIEREQHQQHIQQLTKQAYNKSNQNSAQQSPQTSAQVDNALFTLAEQLQQEQQRNSDLLSKLNQLEDRVNYLSNDTQRLEKVLQRVHGKLSYRLVRGVKNLLSRESRTFNKLEKKEQQPDLKISNYDAWLAEYEDLTPQKLEMLTTEVRGWQLRPQIALLMPVYNPDRLRLVSAIESVLQQVYGHFELCIAVDASTVSYVHEILSAYQERDQRVKLLFPVASEQGAASLLNDCLSLVDADYMSIIGQHDLLAADALYWIVKTIHNNPAAQLIYADEDQMDFQGQRLEPYFKTDWNPELFLSTDFISHSGVYKTQQVKALGGFDSSLETAQSYDLTLRYVADLGAGQICHIPRLLYHTCSTSDSIAKGRDAGHYVQAVKNALQHQQREAEVSVHSRVAGAQRIRYVLPDQLPLVSIVIPTRNGFHLLYRCVQSIFAKTAYSNYELIIIDNGSDDLVTLRYLNRLKQDPRVRIMRDDSPFNYSSLNNKAVAQAKGEIIGLLNNDLEVINEDWLGEMVSHVLHAEVGAVGAKLYYPDNTIQHAGVILGICGVAGHAQKHALRESAGYGGRLLLVQNLSAVTAACLLVRKEVFEAVDGFDEQHLSIAFNDVDFCLRIQEQGYNNLWTPYAEMYHYESASRGYEDTPEKQTRFNKEVAYMKQRWGDSLLIDPAYNPNLTLDRDDFSFACPPRNNI